MRSVSTSDSAPTALDGYASYDEFAERVVASGVVLDPWVWGKPRLAPAPVVLDARTWQALVTTAERVAMAFNEACLLFEEEPGLLESYLGLSEYQRGMWRSTAPLWHGVARADVFLTGDGPVITELNCDTPTGEAEAVVLGALAHARHPDTQDPNADLGARITALVETVASRTLEPGWPRTLGIVYPTEFTEDLALVRLYRAWFEARGWDVVLGSPFNLSLTGDHRAALFGTPVSVLLRHYKTDWWGERESVWDDERFPDREPLRDPLGIVLAASFEGKLAVVNPFGAVVPQNKRVMAFMWDHLTRFSRAAQDAIRAYVPVTRRLETLHEEQLYAQQSEWVIKSDYGAEGEEVVIGKLTSAEIWKKTVDHARPGRWVAQRRFDALTDEHGRETNYGVYVVAGRAAGVYTRTQRGATDDTALSAATLVRLE